MDGPYPKERTISLPRTDPGALAATLTNPAQVPYPLGGPQSLSKGATGAALLHIERALHGLGDWQTVHNWLRIACDQPIAGGPDATLYFGAPALTFSMHAAGQHAGYRRALASLDAKVASLVRQRLDRAHARIDQQARPTLAEFELINGLTGIGAHLLRRDPHGPLARDVLTYLVRLTEPVGSTDLPGWWTDQPRAGRTTPDRPGGHSNHGMAHGITGSLALLSLARLRGIAVEGHDQAILRICAWLDHWRQEHESGPWWPELLTLEDLHRGRPAQTEPLRPSWCYGTPGLARAHQLAAHALADPTRAGLAEQAVVGCLTDPQQQRRITDHSLCHGLAGLYQTVWRITTDADHTHQPELADHLHQLGQRLRAASPDGTGAGFLEGATGLALALTTATTETAPASGWDSCLLLN